MPPAPRAETGGSPPVEIEIPSRSVYVGVVRLSLSTLARLAGLDEATVDDLKIAVSEACANAVISNEEIGGEDPVTINWIEEDGRVVVEVGDRGSLHEPNRPEDTLPGGMRLDMSVALLRSLVDVCEFEARPGGGTLTRLVVHR